MFTLALLVGLTVYALVVELSESLRVTTIALERPCAKDRAAGVTARHLDTER